MNVLHCDHYSYRRFPEGSGINADSEHGKELNFQVGYSSQFERFPSSSHWSSLKDFCTYPGTVLQRILNSKRNVTILSQALLRFNIHLCYQNPTGLIRAQLWLCCRPGVPRFFLFSKQQQSPPPDVSTSRGRHLASRPTLKYYHLEGSVRKRVVTVLCNCFRCSLHGVTARAAPKHCTRCDS